MHPCCQHCNPANERHTRNFRGHMWACYICETERALSAFRAKYLGAT